MTKKKNKSLRILLPVLLIVALVAAGLYVYNLVRTDVAGEQGSSAKYTLVIEDNDFAYEIGAKLKKRRYDQKRYGVDLVDGPPLPGFYIL